MGKFSYKKRKGNRKQSFKNRKRVKRGGDDAAVTSQKEVKGDAAPAQKEVKGNTAAAATVTTTAAADAAPIF